MTEQTISRNLFPLTAHLICHLFAPSGSKYMWFAFPAFELLAEEKVPLSVIILKTKESPALNVPRLKFRPTTELVTLLICLLAGFVMSSSRIWAFFRDCTFKLTGPDFFRT